MTNIKTYIREYVDNEKSNEEVLNSLRVNHFSMTKSQSFDFYEELFSEYIRKQERVVIDRVEREAFGRNIEIQAFNKDILVSTEMRKIAQGKVADMTFPAPGGVRISWKNATFADLKRRYKFLSTYSTSLALRADVYKRAMGIMEDAGLTDSGVLGDIPDFAALIGGDEILDEASTDGLPDISMDL